MARLARLMGVDMDGDESRAGWAQLIDLVVAAEMTALEAPYVLVCTRASLEVSYIQGPYPDGLSALDDLVAMEDSPSREEDTYFTVAPLWPSD